MSRKHWDKSVKRIETAHIRLPDAIAAGRGHVARDHVEVDAYHQTVTPDDIAVLQYTGGTTGVSKGAMLTHANLLVNMEQVMELLVGDLNKGQEVALTALPMYHIFAFNVNLLGFWWLGARNILIPKPAPAVEPQARLRELQDHLDERREHALQRADERDLVHRLAPQTPEILFRRRHGAAILGRGEVGTHHRLARDPGLRPDRNLARPHLRAAGQGAPRLHRRPRPRHRDRLHGR